MKPLQELVRFWRIANDLTKLPRNGYHTTQLMKRLWQIFALILLALVVPASVCCMVPQVVKNQSCDCCSIPDQDHNSPEHQEACPSVTIAHSQLPAVASMPQMPMIELCDMINTISRIHELTAQANAPTLMPTTAPPELRTTWVFASRAALTARAPSELT